MSDKKSQDNAIVRFFKETRGELKKVVYPTFKNVRKNTTVVIVVVIIFGILIAGLDTVFHFGRNALIASDPINQVEQQAPTDGTQIPDGVNPEDVQVNPEDLQVNPEDVQAPADGTVDPGATSAPQTTPAAE